ncbi:lasso RiPP family leader peptide-containing protein [Allokutzneria sp. A3M-2-11 16]|nr:lasso RiPP family leader peptide-containing protein [Allokutzneria sp. A3M-2-11 16]MCP3803399.1 lasso RiPP family leader peptide-containing protein [Allokutzneria sp. A3M-2-11 16]
MDNDILAYEPPALVEAGEFSKVTLGPKGWGFEWDVRCLTWCD